MDLKEIGQLTAPLLHRVLFVCFSEPVAPAPPRCNGKERRPGRQRPLS
jgi:hypothetical protein